MSLLGLAAYDSSGESDDNENSNDTVTDDENDTPSTTVSVSDSETVSSAKQSPEHITRPTIRSTENNPLFGGHIR